jgi:hypothetical protein
MSGKRDLRKLLQHMTPQLQPGTFVFCTFPDGNLPAGLTPTATFPEVEGLRAILLRDEARSGGVPYQFESGLTTLTVHSSRDAVGFLAAVSAVLADAGIPCNAVSGYYQDHFFVPQEVRCGAPLSPSMRGRDQAASFELTSLFKLMPCSLA